MWIIQSLCRMPPRLCLSWWLSFVPSLWCIRSLSRSCQIPSQCRVCALHNPSQRRLCALCSPSFQNLSPRELCCLTPSLNRLRLSQDDSFVSGFQLIHLTVSFVESHLLIICLASRRSLWPLLDFRWSLPLLLVSCHEGVTLIRKCQPLEGLRLHHWPPGQKFDIAPRTPQSPLLATSGEVPLMPLPTCGPASWTAWSSTLGPKQTLRSILLLSSAFGSNSWASTYKIKSLIRFFTRLLFSSNRVFLCSYYCVSRVFNQWKHE